MAILEVESVHALDIVQPQYYTSLFSGKCWMMLLQHWHDMCWHKIRIQICCASRDGACLIYQGCVLFQNQLTHPDDPPIWVGQLSSSAWLKLKISVSSGLIFLELVLQMHLILWMLTTLSKNQTPCIFNILNIQTLHDMFFLHVSVCPSSFWFR